jgi:phosphoribosylamine--glycine ligase
VGVGGDLHAARASAYEALELIDLDGGRFRRDIALAAANGTTGVGA